MILSSACQRQADPFPALSGRHGERRSYTTSWDTISSSKLASQADDLVGTNDGSYLVRFVSGASGGTYGYKLASGIMKWARVNEKALMRDWTEKSFCFAVLTKIRPEVISRRMVDDGFNLRLFASPQSLVIEKHRRLLPEHNLKRINSREKPIELLQFAKSFPTVEGRIWNLVPTTQANEPV